VAIAPLELHTPQTRLKLGAVTRRNRLLLRISRLFDNLPLAIQKLHPHYQIVPVLVGLVVNLVFQFNADVPVFVRSVASDLNDLDYTRRQTQRIGSQRQPLGLPTAALHFGAAVAAELGVGLQFGIARAAFHKDPLIRYRERS
jgi:hypothetical protein